MSRSKRAAISFILFSCRSIGGQTETGLEAAQAFLDNDKFVEAEASARQYLKIHNDSADVHYLLGYVLFKENKPNPSLAEYAEGAKYRNPGAKELEVMGCDYFLLEDYANADKWLTKSLAQNHENALALYFLGRTKYNEKRFEEASQLFLDSLKLDPKNSKAQENLGLSYERLGKTDEAIAAYHAAIAADAGAGERNFGVYVDLGTLLIETNRAPEGIPYLVEAVQLSPQDEQAHRELGKAYLLSNQLQNAQTELEKASQIDPQSASAHFLLAQVYHKLGIANKAKVETERYTALTGSHSSAENSLSEARSFIESGKLDDAEQVIRRYLAMHTDSADGHYLLGYLLFRKQDAKASLAEYTEGAKYRKPSANDLEVVGGDYVLLHDYADADKWFTKSVQWDPGNFQTLYYLGRAKYNENRFDEAVEVFLRCLKIDPKSIKAEDNLGLSYEGLGRTDDAMTAYRAAISWQTESPKDSGPYVNLGALLVNTERSSEAVPYLLEAVQISPDEMRTHRELGKAYLHLNQLQQAQTELEKSAQLAPQNAPVHFILAQVYRKLGLTDKARGEAERYAQLAKAHSTDDPQ